MSDGQRGDGWVVGDRLGLPIPADIDTLREGGAAYLTEAFRAGGVLGPDNCVTAIARLDPFEGGGTGAKASLSVSYEKPGPPTALFVKFSRNFDDPIRDRTRHHMEPEVRLALLSREPGFPVRVPTCLLADFHGESGTGVLMTESIAFSQGAIEPHYPKCADHLMPDAIGHYRTLIVAVARLAGAHKAGRLPARVAAEFPFDVAHAVAGNPLPAPDRLDAKLARLADFAARHPTLLPPAIDAAFLAGFAEEARLFARHAEAIARFLHAEPALIALCHWNANVDNAWFWREADGCLACGLMDWGSVGQMSLCMTIWGCLSGAEPELWDAHLDELLALFVRSFAGEGAPPLDPALLRLHLGLYVAMMGLAWLIDAPARIRRELPDLDAITDRRDPRFAASETARTQLLMLANVLAFWRRESVGETVARLFGG